MWRSLVMASLKAASRSGWAWTPSTRSRPTYAAQPDHRRPGDTNHEAHRPRHRSGYVTQLTAWHRASCARAQRVTDWLTPHETEGHGFRADGVRWTQHTYPTANPNRQCTLLTAPHREIDIVHWLSS